MGYHRKSLLIIKIEAEDGNENEKEGLELGNRKDTE